MNNEKRWRQRFENFEKSFELFCRRQKEYEENLKGEVYQMAFVQSYEILTELSWKTLKDYLENMGYDKLAAPKQIIRQAFQAEIIREPDLWMEALERRNQTSHIYNPKILESVLKFINERFYKIVRDLYYELKKEKDKS